MSRLRAAYQEMYLVTKNVYSKVLDCIDERTRQMTEDLNRQPEGEEEERRPAEEYFDDLSYQDIDSGVHSQGTQQVPIQEGETRAHEQIVHQRPYYPRLTYEPDLPPIREVIREPEIVPPLPRLSHSTFPRLMYKPTARDMELQSEIISQGTPRSVSATSTQTVGGQSRRPSAADVGRPRSRSQSEQIRHSGSEHFQHLPPRPPSVPPPTPPPVSMPRQPIRVSYQDEGVETIQDCVPGVTKSICQGGDKRGGFQCDVCKKFLSTRHSLNRHMITMHRSRQPSVSQSEASTSQASEQRAPSFSTWGQEMETGSLPIRRKRAADEAAEYTDPEDVPLSKVYVRRGKRKDPSGSGKNNLIKKQDNFESWN